MFKKTLRTFGFAAAVVLVLALTGFRCTGAEEQPAEPVMYDPDMRIGSQSMRAIDQKIL